MQMLLILFTALSLHSSSVPTLNIEALKTLQGLYTGTLTYKDYTSNEMVTLPLVASCGIEDDKVDLSILLNEWGKTYDQHYVYRIKDGVFNWSGDAWKMEKENFTGAEAFSFVVSRDGKDGNENKACTFRLTFSYQNGLFIITKEVKFKDEAGFFMRNEYRMTRLRQ